MTKAALPAPPTSHGWKPFHLLSIVAGTDAACHTQGRMKAPDILAITLRILFGGVGALMNTLGHRLARIVGVALIAVGGAGLLVWFVYLRDVIEPSITRASCSNVVRGNNTGAMTNNCKD
jgi:uncharacterized membrane protein